MIRTKKSGAANGAAKTGSFAFPHQDNNGNGHAAPRGNGGSSRYGPSPPRPRKAKAPAGQAKGQVAVEATTDATAQRGETQTQSRNGNGQEPLESGWNLKINSYGERLFTKILNDTLRDPRLIGLAFKVVCYVLSKPAGWQVNGKDLRRQLGCGEPALRAAMKAIAETGRAQLYRGDRARWHWQIRESNKVPWNEDGSVSKIEHYQKGQFFTAILNDTLRDKSLTGTALKIVCDTLSRPATWQLWLWELRERWWLSDNLISNAMRQAVKAGYALLTLNCHGRRGRRYRIRESPELDWPRSSPKNISQRKQQSEKTAASKNDRPFTNDRISKKDRKISANASIKQPARTRSGSLSVSALPLLEEGMAAVQSFTSLLSERFPRRWMPVTKCTDALEDALCRAVETEGDVEEFERLCQNVARVCEDPRFEGRGSEYSYTDESGEKFVFVVPKAQRKHRGRNSIMDLIWKNYL